MRTFCTDDFFIVQQGKFPSNVEVYRRLSDAVLGSDGDGSSFEKAKILVAGSLADQFVLHGQRKYYKLLVPQNKAYTITCSPIPGEDADMLVSCLEGSGAESQLSNIFVSEAGAGIEETVLLDRFGVYYIQIYGYSENGAHYTLGMVEEVPSFSLSTGGYVTVVQGKSSNFSVYLHPIYGFNETVTPTFENVPPEITITPIDFSPGAYYQSVTISTTKQVPVGGYSITMAALDSFDNRITADFTIAVQAPVSKYTYVECYAGTTFGANVGQNLVNDSDSSYLGRRYNNGFTDNNYSNQEIVKGRIPITADGLVTATGRYGIPTAVSVTVNGDTKPYSFTTHGDGDFYSVIDDVDFSLLPNGIYQYSVTYFDDNDVPKTSAARTVFVMNSPANVSITCTPQQNFATFQFNITEMYSRIFASHVYVGKTEFIVQNSTYDTAGGSTTGYHYQFNNKPTNLIPPGFNFGVVAIDSFGQVSATEIPVTLQYSTEVTGRSIINPITWNINSSNDVTLDTTPKFFTFPVVAGKVYRLYITDPTGEYGGGQSSFAVWTPDGTRWAFYPNASNLYFQAKQTGMAIAYGTASVSTNMKIRVAHEDTALFHEWRYAYVNIESISKEMSGYGWGIDTYASAGKLFANYFGMFRSGRYRLEGNRTYRCKIELDPIRNQYRTDADEWIYQDEPVIVMVWDISTLTQVFRYELAPDKSSVRTTLEVPFTVPSNGHYAVLMTRNGFRPLKYWIETDGYTETSMSASLISAGTVYNTSSGSGGSTWKHKFDAANGDTINWHVYGTGLTAVDLYDYAGNLLKHVDATGGPLSHTTLSHLVTQFGSYYVVMTSAGTSSISYDLSYT